MVCFHKLNCDVKFNVTECFFFFFFFFFFGGGGGVARHENLYMGVHTKCLFT